MRTVANELGLAPNTVAGAYKTLGDRGFTVGRGRAGTFVADRPALGGAIAVDVPEGMIDLANGHPDSELLPDLGEALRVVDYEPAIAFRDWILAEISAFQTEPGTNA